MPEETNCVACKEWSKLFYDEVMPYLQRPRTVVCAHCDIVVSSGETETHWETCPEHPAREEITLLWDSRDSMLAFLHSIVASLHDPDNVASVRRSIENVLAVSGPIKRAA